MQWPTSEWHIRYRLQARWTREIRTHLLNQIEQTNIKILEIGCGTGAVLQDFEDLGYPNIFGLDCDFHALIFAKGIIKKGEFINGNAFHLPFKTASFNLTYCHYLLLWLKNPINALVEMARVTRPGGFVCAFAEPDYTSRIVYPVELKEFAELQSKSLHHQGVDISIGQKLSHLFIETDLEEIRAGIIGAKWEVNHEFSSSEYQLMQNDLDMNQSSFDRIQLKELMERKDLVNFIPTFFTYGRVKENRRN